MRAPAAIEHRLAFSPGELAEAGGCTRQFIYDQMAAGNIASVTRGSRRFIPRSAALAFFGESPEVERDAD